MADQETRRNAAATSRRAGPSPALVGMLALFLAVFVLSDRASAPRVVQGWAMPNAAGTAISLHESPSDEWGEGYIVAGARWTDPAGSWHEGDDTPTCIGTETSSLTHVELGIITVKAEGASWAQVVWLRCLE